MQYQNDDDWSRSISPIFYKGGIITVDKITHTYPFMLVQIFRSDRKEDTYLYVKKDQKLEELPEALMSMLGELEEVMMVDLNQRTKLAMISADTLKTRIEDDGYWLQFPPAHGHILDSEQCPV